MYKTQKHLRNLIKATKYRNLFGEMKKVRPLGKHQHLKHGYITKCTYNFSGPQNLQNSFKLIKNCHTPR